MNSPLDHALALLARARDDLYVVQRLRAEPDAPAWVLGFHAQQGVEKAVKAVLTGEGIEYPRTHNLVMLIELVRRAQLPLPADADRFGQLVPFGVVLRYEDIVDDGLPRIASDWLEEVAKRTIDWAAGFLGAASQ